MVSYGEVKNFKVIAYCLIFPTFLIHQTLFHIMNWIVIILTALIPMIVGFIWYHPKVLGNIWMKASGVTPEMASGGNMPVIFGVSFVMSVILAFGMQSQVIHQVHVGSIFFGLPDAEALTRDFMTNYGDRYRTFGHGLLHGAIAAFMLILPVLATNALFERKGFAYIAVNFGYWLVTLTLMGGVLAQFITR